MPQTARTTTAVSRRRFLAVSGGIAGAAGFDLAARSRLEAPMVARTPFNLSAIEALTFDVGGTVFDWHRTVRDGIAQLAAAKHLDLDAARFTNRWRRGLFDVLGRVRRGELPFMNIDAMHRLALDALLEQQAITALSEDEKQQLVGIWHRIKTWPDARSGLAQLRTRFTVSGLSILSFALLVDASKHADLHWDAIISCEFLGYYKPDPKAYQRAATLLGHTPAQVMMVAAHPGDLNGARHAGFRTAYVPRPGEYGDEDDRELSPGTEFDVVATDFNELAVKLGAVA